MVNINITWFLGHAVRYFGKFSKTLQEINFGRNLSNMIADTTMLSSLETIAGEVKKQKGVGNSPLHNYALYIIDNYSKDERMRQNLINYYFSLLGIDKTSGQSNSFVG